MKRSWVLGLAAMLVGIGASSAASAMIFRPDNPPSTPQAYADLFQINPDQLGTTFTVNSSPCSEFGGLPSDLKGMVSCFGFDNATNKSITKVVFSFTVPTGSALVGQPIQCEAGNFLANWTCPSGNMEANDTYTMVFSGGNSISANTNFYFGSDQANLPPFSMTPLAVPEPAILGMFGLGLLGIGVAIGWRRRGPKARS